MAACAQVKVMCMGDSLTLGAGMGVQGGGYRYFLKALCDQRGMAIDFVGSSTEYPGPLLDREHDGHGGWTTSDLVHGQGAGGARTWVKTYRPNVVLLMVGRNDSDALNLQAVYANYVALLDAINDAEPAVSVVFSNVLYSANPDAYDLQKCAVADAAVQQAVYVSQLAGRKAQYLDCKSVIGTNPAYFSDNVHLSDLGYQRLAAAWFSRLYSKPVRLAGLGTPIYP